MVISVEVELGILIVNSPLFLESTNALEFWPTEDRKIAEEAVTFVFWTITEVFPVGILASPMFFGRERSLAVSFALTVKFPLVSISTPSPKAVWNFRVVREFIELSSGSIQRRPRVSFPVIAVSPKEVVPREKNSSLTLKSLRVLESLVS